MTIRRRWLAFAVTAAAAIGIAIALFFIVGRLGGSGPGSADDVLAGALDAILDPASVGLETYAGLAELSESSDDEAAGGAVQSGQIKVWFKARNRYRYEVSPLSGSDGHGQLLFVADGDRFWAYDSASNTYGEARPEDLLMTQLYLTPFAFTGGYDIRSVPLETVLAGFNWGGRRSVLVGDDVLLGRPVYVIEISPAWERSYYRPGEGTSVVESGGVVRFWLDKEFLFTLRMQQDLSKGETLDMRFTQIEFNGDVDDELFRFEPPEGATQVDGRSFFESVGEVETEAIPAIPITPEAAGTAVAIETPGP